MKRQEIYEAHFVIAIFNGKEKEKEVEVSEEVMEVTTLLWDQSSL